MRNVLSVLFLVVFGLALSASAAEVKVTKADLDNLEKQLATAPLLPEKVTDADFDDDSDEDDELSPRWNPIKWTKNKLKNRCVCENGRCDCCFKVKIFSVKACFSAEVLSAQQKIDISLNFNDQSLVHRSFGLNRADSVCGPIPVTGLTFMQFCLTQNSGIESNGAVRSCTSVEFKIGDKTGAVLQFECLQVKQGKITIGGHQEVDKSAIFTLKAKNPFKAAVKLYKKMAGKN